MKLACPVGIICEKKSKLSLPSPSSPNQISRIVLRTYTLRGRGQDSDCPDVFTSVKRSAIKCYGRVEKHDPLNASVQPGDKVSNVASIRRQEAGGEDPGVQCQKHGFNRSGGVGQLWMANAFTASNWNTQIEIENFSDGTKLGVLEFNSCRCRCAAFG